jgi:NADH dehydrogenase FAD-containing subunit
MQVVALIDRAGTLTADEINRLYAAGDAAWYAAGDAAWYAAGNAAWDAARDAAWNAARDAARDAALALVGRDLIGGTFTQQHYDTLTGPWRKAIGPIHPDDEVL